MMIPHKKTLVLDLDETLVHSTTTGGRHDFTVEVSEWFKVVVFTASMPEYADPVIDWLDSTRTLISKRYFRDSCTPSGQSFMKDLQLVEQDLSKVILIDNAPFCFGINPDNGVPIETWINNTKDECLLDLLPFLDALRFTEDVRSVLSLRAGLSAANALLKRNIPFTVFEKEKNETRIGGGIALHHDVLPLIQTFPIDQSDFKMNINDMLTQIEYSKNGDIIRISDIPYKSAHWPIIYEILAESIPEEKIKYERELVYVTQNEEGVIAEFKGGRKYRGKVLIGADGLLSQVRRLVFKSDVLRYSGYFAWRGMLSKTQLSQQFPEESFILELSDNCHAVIYHLGDYINWLVYQNVDDGSDYSVNQQEAIGKISRNATERELQDFRAMVKQEFRPILVELFTKSKPFINHMYDRDVINKYSNGRVLLIGDAAHPSVPHFIKGATMAIEDGYHLGDLYNPDYKKWFHDFEQKRVKECNQNVLISKNLGRVKQGLVKKGKDWSCKIDGREYARLCNDGIAPSFGSRGYKSSDQLCECEKERTPEGKREDPTLKSKLALADRHKSCSLKKLKSNHSRTLHSNEDSAIIKTKGSDLSKQVMEKEIKKEELYPKAYQQLDKEFSNWIIQQSASEKARNGSAA
ncbi:Nuclear envelope morphology protein 1 [Terramyces sp. JEL0728]|nr:Nuclear envelope morphology protein 1 [Terramyces sp. JEL0728]